MNKGSTIFLRLVIILIGAAVLAIYIFALPKVIGSIDLWGYDPILLGIYIPGIPFFIALAETWKLLNYIDVGTAFSDVSVKALRNIKKCAGVISLIYALGLPYIFYVAEMDDAPGVILIAFIIIGASLVIAVFAAVLQKLLRNAIDIKAENDLTV